MCDTQPRQLDINLQTSRCTSFNSVSCLFVHLWPSGSLPNVLQQAEVPLVLQQQCQDWLPEYTITSSMLCAGFPEGGVDTCQVTLSSVLEDILAHW